MKFHDVPDIPLYMFTSKKIQSVWWDAALFLWIAKTSGQETAISLTDG